MALTLGEKLRQAREAKGISVSEVAEQTRIAPLYIESIDNDDYRALPGGIFNRGFIKAYAKYVGVDEQEALSDYSRLLSDTEGTDVEEVKTYKPQVLTDDHQTHSMVPTIIVAVIVLGLMTGVVLFLVNYLRQPSLPSPPETKVSDINSAPANVAVESQSPVETASPAATEKVASSEAPTVSSTVNAEVKISNSVSNSNSSTSLIQPAKPKASPEKPKPVANTNKPVTTKSPNIIPVKPINSTPR